MKSFDPSHRCSICWGLNGYHDQERHRLHERAVRDSQAQHQLDMARDRSTPGNTRQARRAERRNELKRQARGG
jgi:hypothetical protein